MNLEKDEDEDEGEKEEGRRDLGSDDDSSLDAMVECPVVAGRLVCGQNGLCYQCKVAS